ADGSHTTALLSVDEMARRWRGTTPFDRVLREALDLRILQESRLQIGTPNEQRSVSLGHDALAKVVDSWAEGHRIRARVWKRTKWTAAAVFLAAFMAFLALIARGQAVRAQAARDLAEQRRQEALANLLIAQDVADQMLTRVGDIDLAVVPQMDG